MKQSPSTPLKIRNLRDFPFVFSETEGEFFYSLNDFRLSKSNQFLVGRKATETETAKWKSLFSRNIAPTLWAFYAAAAVSSATGTEARAGFGIDTAATIISSWFGYASKNHFLTAANTAALSAKRPS